MDKCLYRCCETNIPHLDNRRRLGNRADVHRETSVGHGEEVVEALQDQRQTGTGDYKNRFTVNIVLWELQ